MRLTKTQRSVLLAVRDDEPRGMPQAWKRTAEALVGLGLLIAVDAESGPFRATTYSLTDSGREAVANDNR